MIKQIPWFEEFGLVSWLLLLLFVLLREFVWWLRLLWVLLASEGVLDVHGWMRDVEHDVASTDVSSCWRTCTYQWFFTCFHVDAWLKSSCFRARLYLPHLDSKQVILLLRNMIAVNSLFIQTTLQHLILLLSHTPTWHTALRFKCLCFHPYFDRWLIQWFGTYEDSDWFDFFAGWCCELLGAEVLWVISITTESIFLFLWIY